MKKLLDYKDKKYYKHVYEQGYIQVTEYEIVWQW